MEGTNNFSSSGKFLSYILYISTRRQIQSHDQLPDKKVSTLVRLLLLRTYWVDHIGFLADQTVPVSYLVSMIDGRMWTDQSPEVVGVDFDTIPNARTEI